MLAGADGANLAAGAFGPAEQAMLNGADSARLIAGWCAKEAVAKAMGQGLNGRPKSFVLTALEADSARVTAPDGTEVPVMLGATVDRVLALALRQGQS